MAGEMPLLREVRGRIRRTEAEMPPTKRIFVARAIYHHKVRTNEHVTILAYHEVIRRWWNGRKVEDSQDAYELFDDREAEHDYLAGTEEYIFEEWGKRNRQLVEDGFQRDNLTGENKWQQFIS